MSPCPAPARRTGVLRGIAAGPGGRGSGGGRDWSTSAAWAAIPSDALLQRLQPQGNVNDYAGILSPAERTDLENRAGRTAAKDGRPVRRRHPQVAGRRPDRRLHQQAVRQMGRRREGEEQRRDALGGPAGPQGPGRGRLRAGADPARRPGRPRARRTTLSGLQAAALRPGTDSGRCTHRRDHRARRTGLAGGKAKAMRTLAIQLSLYLVSLAFSLPSDLPPSGPALADDNSSSLLWGLCFGGMPMLMAWTTSPAGILAVGAARRGHVRRRLEGRQARRTGQVRSEKTGLPVGPGQRSGVVRRRRFWRRRFGGGGFGGGGGGFGGGCSGGGGASGGW